MEQFIKNLAKGAGAILRDGFRKKIQINHKQGHWDVVTQYDLMANDFIIGKIKKKFPSHGIISEESGGSKKKNFWIIDPMDGSRNFSRGVPFFCVLVAFVSSGRTTLGVVYDPMHDELFFAKRNNGAYLNGKSIQVTSSGEMTSALASLVWHPERTAKNISSKIQKMILEKAIWNSSLASGGLTLAYVAAGRLDFDLGATGFLWDYAAGALIAREAGARVTDLKGNPHKWNFDEVLAANPVLHRAIMKYLHE